MTPRELGRREIGSPRRSRLLVGGLPGGSWLDRLTAPADEARSPLRATLAVRLVAVLAAALALVLAVGAYRERARARHLAVPVLSDPSVPAAPGAELAEGRACELAEVERVGARVTALLVASDGALHVGTFDHGWVRFEGGPRAGAPPPEVPLSGRERFVNALAEHDGLVWAATQAGVVAADGDRRVLALLPDDAVTALEVAGGTLYAGTARGVVRLSVERGAEPVAATGPSGEPLRVTALAASGGSLWIGTASGAYSLPLATVEAPLLARTARWHPLVFGEPAAETNVVTALAPSAGGVVAGTDDGGVVRIDADGRVAAVRFRDARANEVNPGAAAAVVGGVLLGTQGAGVLHAAERGSGLDVRRVAAGEISALWADGGALIAGRADGSVAAGRCPRREDAAAALR